MTLKIIVIINMAMTLKSKNPYLIIPYTVTRANTGASQGRLENFLMNGRITTPNQISI